MLLLLWWLMIALTLGIVFALIHSLRKENPFNTPCPKCKGKMRWIRGRSSVYRDEAMFQCKRCKHCEHRGGFASEMTMELKELH